MAVGRAARWEAIKPRAAAVFGSDESVLRSVEATLVLLEMAWHDCYGEVAPPDDVVENVLACSDGTLEGLIDAAQLAVMDRRDLQVRAEALRERS